MRNLLIVLTVVEIVVFVGALAVYLILIAASLRRISTSLGKVTFGVRAIETQCASVGPSVLKVNEQLKVIAGALDTVSAKAESLAAPSPPSDSLSSAASPSAAN
ncbi:MAG: hypothetical protein OXE79_06445 [Acidimicrobiaceae bacterium]|nr:hypothetical protein [Acidimicrobiaceae bacterium]